MKVANEREGFSIFFCFKDFRHDIAVFQVGEDPGGNQIEIYYEVPETSWQSVDTIIRGEPLDLES